MGYHNAPFGWVTATHLEPSNNNKSRNDRNYNDINSKNSITNISLFTSSVTLITSPESKLGVWVDRIQINGLLVGLGDDYPSLILYSKDADIKVGDFVSSSPASTLLPPNIPIGIVQSIDETLKSKKTAKISLLAKPHVIDWVQILKVNIK